MATSAFRRSFWKEFRMLRGLWIAVLAMVLFGQSIVWLTSPATGDNSRSAPAQRRADGRCTLRAGCCGHDVCRRARGRDRRFSAGSARQESATVHGQTGIRGHKCRASGRRAARCGPDLGSLRRARHETFISGVLGRSAGSGVRFQHAHDRRHDLGLLSHSSCGGR